MKGFKILESLHPASRTADRIADQIEKEGWHLFARIDHAGEARKKGIELRPTELILFGNPSIGTQLMLDKQTAAVDLPVKALVWEDETGRVSVGYNTTQWLRERHGLTDENTLQEIGNVLERVCSGAAGAK